jgi:CRP/FNR family transcriptional regulator
MTCGNCDCPFHEIQAEHSPFSSGEFHCLVTETVKQVRFAVGDVLFAQGEPSESLYSLTSGLVKITCHTPHGREQIVGLSSPGKLLAGLQSLSDDIYCYSAVAETPVAACKIRHRALLHAINHRGDVALRVVSALNAQLAHSRQLMLVMGHKCAAAKIAAFISLIIPKSERGNRRFTLPFSRADIASLLGLSEETVCRQMARMKRKGILYAPRGKIEILDWDQLQAVADEVCVEVA